MRSEISNVNVARYQRPILIATLFLYALIQIIYVTATPLQTLTLPDTLPQTASASTSLLVGIGPDEKEHFLYILSLANNGTLPKPSPEYRASARDYVSYEVQHPPLYYALNAGIDRIFGVLLGDRSIWYLLRALCSVCGGFVIVLCARAAAIAFPDRPIVVLGTAPVVAFTPIFGHLMGNLSNEPLAMVFTAWAWLQMARLLRADAPPTPRQAALLGLALGLAAETRLTALMWLPAAVIVLLARPNPRARVSPRALLAFCGVFLALLTPWLIHNYAAYGTPFFRTFDRPLLHDGVTFRDFLAGNAPVPREFHVSIEPRYTLLNYAATGWMPFWLIKFFLPFPPGLNGVIFWNLIFVLVDVALFIILLLHALHAAEARQKERKNGIAIPNRYMPDAAGRVLLWAAGLTVATCVAAVLRHQLYADWTAVLSPGRYLVAAIPASALLCTFALSTLQRQTQNPARRALAPCWIVAAVFCAFDIQCALYVRQFYRLNPRQASVQEAPKTFRPAGE